MGKRLQVLIEDAEYRQIQRVARARRMTVAEWVRTATPMYLVGAPHRHKADAQILLETCIKDRRRLVTEAEVLQKVLHRYSAIDRREAPTCVRRCIRRGLGNPAAESLTTP
jgi:hypothetical protein